MTEINISLIKILRKKTNANLLLCKKALIKSNGNIELATKILYNLGKINIFNKQKNNSFEGLIELYVDKNRKNASIIEICCETDFVSKNLDFINFSKFICKKICVENFEIDKINLKLKNEIHKLIFKFGENIYIRRALRFKGENIDYYLHLKKIGVLIDTDIKDKKLSKKIAMHIAAKNPLYINKESIPKKILKNEYEIYYNKYKKLGKSDFLSKKISNGKLEKFIENISLMDQIFIMDNNQKISSLLNNFKSKINNFIRFEKSESINNLLTKI